MNLFKEYKARVLAKLILWYGGISVNEEEYKELLNSLLEASK